MKNCTSGETLPNLLHGISAKILFAALCCLLHFGNMTAQSVGVNDDNSVPDASAMLDVKSSSKGMLVPRLNSAQRTGITNAVVGANLDDRPSKADQGSMYVLSGTYSCGGGMAAPGNERVAQAFENQLDVRCSPNPFSDELSIEVAASGPAKLTVTDAAGRVMACVDLPVGAVRFDLRTVGFHTGLYFVEVSTESGARVMPVALVR